MGVIRVDTGPWRNFYPRPAEHRGDGSGEQLEGAPPRPLECEHDRLIAEARAEGDLAGDVDPATMARFSTALALGYHLLHCAGVADPAREHWASLLTRMVGSVFESR